jgi:ABC-type glycerol-3-phosphate transport system substrate-binding protein
VQGLTRRRLLSALPLACLAGVTGACGRKVVQVERVVEKEVTTVITEIVRETVIVQGTPRIVERTIAVPMVVTAQPTARPRVALVADVMDYGWTAFGRAMAPAFEEMFPSIRMEWRTSADWGRYAEHVAALTAAGQLGDLLEAPLGTLLVEWFDRGVIQPLDDVVADERFDTTGIFAGALNACTRGGHLAAVPLLCHAGDCLLVYRRPILDAVGVDPPTSGWVLADLMQAAGAVTRGLGAERPPVYGYGDDYRLPAAYPAMRAFGAELLDAGGRACAIQSPEGVAYLGWLKDAMHVERIAPRPHEVEGSLAGMFAAGRLAMVRSDLMGLVALQHLGGDEVGGTLLPAREAGGRRGAVAEGMAYCITAQSQHPIEAFQWIKFMSGREMGVQMFLRGYAEPGCRAASWSDPRVLERCPTCAREAEVAETAEPERLPWNLRLADCLRAWHEETDRLARDDSTPEVCAAAIDARINALLADQTL